MSDKTLLVTHPNGDTFEVTSVSGITSAYNALLDVTALFEAAPDTREQWFDLLAESRLYAAPAGALPYDYHDYGPGCVAASGEAGNEDLRESIDDIDSALAGLRLVNRATYLSARGKIDASKRGTVAFFSWKEHWVTAKAKLASQRAAMRELRAMRWIVLGELRARTVESNPTVTPWNTGDNDGPADVSAMITSGELPSEDI